MSARALTPAELHFLENPRGLARIATVDAAGLPHVVPTGWSFSRDTGELHLTGRGIAGSRRVRNLSAHPVAAAVIDGVDTENGWHAWALVVRGPAAYDAGIDAIRLTPADVTSWGIADPASEDPASEYPASEDPESG